MLDALRYSPNPLTAFRQAVSKADQAKRLAMRRRPELERKSLESSSKRLVWSPPNILSH